MKFNADHLSFGRHETFVLRYSWLTKGFQAIADANFNFADTDEATIKLGVGKNMVASIRYWLRACQMVEQKSVEPSELGSLILDKDNGLDPYLEDEATLWLIHWLLATNSAQATCWFWFFNKFHKPEFTTQELQTAVADYLKENVIKGKRPATKTLKNDTTLLPRMYTLGKSNTAVVIEENLDTPLSQLHLINASADGKSFQSKLEARSNLPVAVVGFAVTELMQNKKVAVIPIEELLYSRDQYAALGSVFRLTETDLITKLEQMIDYIPKNYAIRETSGIHQLYCLKEKIKANNYLKKHYKKEQSGATA